MLKLDTLQPAAGSRKARTRVGRGEGSGHGKTSGRGGKGQTARTGGGVRPGFEGGQMPLYRRIPKLGFRSRQKTYGINQYDVINLSTLNGFEAGSVVDADAVYARGYGRTAQRRAGVKILGNGILEKKLTLKVQACSEAAKKAIEAAGGTIEIVPVE